MIEQMLVDRSVVAVTATAGAGKTTAVAHAVEDRDAVAWLTLDEGDVAPGRLLVYLQESLALVAPGVAGVVDHALTGGLRHVEAAALLMEALDGQRAVTLVLDEFERVAESPSAVGVLETVVRHAPPTFRLVVVGRRDPSPALFARNRIGSPPLVGDADLAFTEDEAAEAVRKVRGGERCSPGEVVAATEGWVTGVLFEVARADTPTAHDAASLDGYFSTQILDQLDHAQREFLVLTAPARRVDAATAQRLGLRDAATVIAALRGRHLPVTWEEDGRVMVSHPRFREYLLDVLGRRDDATVFAQFRRYGDLLRAEGLLEEATEAYFTAGAAEQAALTANDVIGRLVERLDLDLVERWIRRVPPPLAGELPGLLGAELAVAIGREEFDRGRRAADALARHHAVAALPPRTQALMAWCYWVVGRPDRARHVASQMAPGPERRIIRYQLTLNDNEPSAERESPPRPTGDLLDAQLMRTNLVSGRLRAAAEAPVTPWSSAVVAPWRLEAAAATGRLTQAYEELTRALEAEKVSARLEGIVAPQILGDLGRAGQALTQVLKARPRIEAGGSVVWRIQSLLVEARLRLRHDLDRGPVTELLSSLISRDELGRYAFLAEQAAMLAGLSSLLEGRFEAARTSLREATESMLAGRRILDLPAAAVYLAEAAWRCGDEEEADRSTDIALQAAHEQGSNHLLLRALSEFPAVLARRLDAEPHADSPWHDLGRVLMTHAVRLGRDLDGVVRFHDLGEPRVVVDGEVVRPRVGKSLEVLAFLAEAPDHRVPRDALMHAVFDGRSDHAARTYLRQAIHRLRDLVPPGAEVLLDAETVQLKGATISTDSARLEAKFDEAAALGDAGRLPAIEDALRLYETGEYLAGRHSSWIDDRRAGLAVRALDARCDAAELLFAATNPAAAQAHLDVVLTADPFRERAWRLAMRIAATFDDGDAVVSVFRRCERALAEIGIAPSPSTRRLVDDLRR